ncbi:glycosyltransferase [Aeoliella sp. ICT_H6.2]|uniref:Glycosyltransferase n=1 Tax=Aeoliella straminimaris TaxID=2954799 RepID=A0A9X2FBZ3_9BACT|nr:glycosyltransferase [Aeoliella straminimaris]
MSTNTEVRFKVGGVAIGRNEGERLRACLGSLVRDLDHVVYVDSGSEDDSLEMAEQLGVETLLLDTAEGFTAARARNAGFRRLLEIAPEVELIQFVDGDCEVVEGWIPAATQFLQTHPQVAVACGRRREIDPDCNAYHRLAEMEWDTLPGEAHSCGGDALIKRQAFEQAGGYRNSLIAGEEPELCTRLRKDGWTIWRLDEEMTLHDVRMSRFGQWWKRAVRAGHAYAEVAVLHGSLTERHRWRKLLSIYFWALLPVFALSLFPLAGTSPLVVTGFAYAIQWARIARYRMRQHGDPLADAFLYAASCIVANWPTAIGSLKYIGNRLRGSRSQLIEYSQHTAGLHAHQTADKHT